MMIETKIGVPMDAEMLANYFRTLVNLLFKILPIREANEPTLSTYISSLQAEIMGCNEFIVAIHNDPMVLTIISILQYLSDNPDCDIRVVKREVFRSINICNKLRAKYVSEMRDMAQ